MALQRRGSRFLVIDGVVYRWRVRKKPTYHQALEWSHLLLAVEHAMQSGSVLVATLPQYHPSSWIGSEAVPVTPAEVERIVQKALHAGWRPTEKGKPFCLALNQVS